MSLSSLRNDKCFYEKSLKESKSVGCYQMYGGKYVNNRQCMIDFGILGGNTVSLFNGNLVDLESDMMGISRPATLCPSHKFTPRCNEPCSGGLPSGPINCNAELIHKPSCQLICYKPVVYASAPQASICPGTYGTQR